MNDGVGLSRWMSRGVGVKIMEGSGREAMQVMFHIVNQIGGELNFLGNPFKIKCVSCFH